MTICSDNDDDRNRPCRGKCLTCGLLAFARNKAEILEFDLSRRANVQRGAGGFSTSEEPICIRKIPFGCESEEPWLTRDQSGDRRPFHAMMLRVLAKDRKCPSWFEFYPGVGPLKSLELSILDQIEKEMEAGRRAWTEQMEQERRLWERQQDVERHSREARQEADRLRLASHERHRNLTLTMVAIGISVVQTVSVRESTWATALSLIVVGVLVGIAFTIWMKDWKAQRIRQDSQNREANER